MTSDIKFQVIDPHERSFYTPSHKNKMKASGYNESEIDIVTDFYNNKQMIKRRLRDIVKCRCGELEDVCYVCRMEKMRDCHNEN